MTNGQPWSSAAEAGTGEPVVRVSTLELFFDLVFVFTITQLTAVLADDLTPRGAGRVVLMLSVILWMYGGYAWLTNAVAPNSRFRRTLMLVGMGGFLAIALAIPAAFGPAGWLFGLGYFVVNAVHSGLFIVAGGPGAARAMLRLGPLNLVSATLVLVGGFLPGAWRYVAWAAAFGVMLASPYLNRTMITGFSISPAHFVERHGLLIIVALGESIVAIGVGASGLPVDARLVAVAVLGLSLSYLMWWVYFGDDEREPERALAAVAPERRARVALASFGWAHWGLLLGILVVAAGIKKAIGHLDDNLTLGQALALGVGLCIYLMGDVAFRQILGLGRVAFRLVGALLALATVPLGLVAAIGQIASLIAVLVLMLYAEERSHALGPSRVGPANLGWWQRIRQARTCGSRCRCTSGRRRRAMWTCRRRRFARGRMDTSDAARGDRRSRVLPLSPVCRRPVRRTLPYPSSGWRRPCSCPPCARRVCRCSRFGPRWAWFVIG